MSRHKKLERFAAIKSMPNVAEWDKSLKGKWGAAFFKNINPLVLELACGKGEYTVALAEKYPHINFLGLDIKGNRQYVGAKMAMEKQLTNVGFLRCFIDHVETYFDAGEVSEIWITFPDPYLKPSKKNKRLTSPVFIERYRKICPPGARVHLKTDDDTLFQSTLESVAECKCTIVFSTHDLYNQPLPYPELEIKTYYEGKHLAAGKSIKYICFTL